jgi:Flp pilus assembly protein TadG
MQFESYPGESVMKRLRDESGQALVIAALSMTCLLGFVALATDVGVMLREKRLAQIAADSAAIAGALELNFSDVSAAAQAAAAQNGFTSGANGATVTVNGPSAGPALGPHAGNGSYVEVIVSQNQPTIFMWMFGRSAVTVNARAVATLGPSQSCLYTLGTTGTGISLSNNAKLNAPGCGIIVDSSSATAISVVGGAKITAGSVGVVGGASTSNGGSTSPAAVSNIAPTSDPLSALQPPSYNPASCGSDPLTHFGNGGSSYSVGPGSPFSTTQNGNTVCYTSLTLGANGDTVTVNPGIYVLTGPLTFASGTTLGGQGVTFYLTGGGSVSIGNNANPNFSAPTSGAYNGILFYQDRSNANTASIQGGASSTLSGILYFPDTALTIGNGTTSTISASVIAKSLTITGGSNLQENNYATVNPSSPITAAKLVE